MSREPQADGFNDFVATLSAQSLPPVHRWRPTVARDMDLVIDATGEWYYQGGGFERRDLMRLLSTVMIRDDEGYFLVSPTEKLRITVEDVPFLATDFEAAGEGDEQRIVFDTNVDYKVALDIDHPIEVRPHADATAGIPYLLVRDGLEARLARGVFYRLVDLGEERDVNGRRTFGIPSHGHFFPLGEVSW